MHRKQLLRLLNNYFPSSYEEKIYQQQIIEFVLEHPDCFERWLPIGHITGSAWLLSKDGASVLLTHHAKLNRWVQLGGHCDGDSDVLKVAIKEAQEESGIINIEPVSSEIFDIDIHLIPKNPATPAHYHYDIRFLLQVMSDETIIKSDESHDLQWFSDQLPTNDNSIVRMFNKWRTGYSTTKSKYVVGKGSFTKL